MKNAAAEIIQKGTALLREAAESAQGRPRTVRNTLLEQVPPAAQAFVAAVWCRRAQAEFSPGSLTWVVCRDARAQEDFFAELAPWLSGAIFLPDQNEPLIPEAAADPTGVAERLDALWRLRRPLEPGAVVVVHLDSLDQRVPRAGELESATQVFRPGDQLERDRLAERLTAAGYQAVRQVTEQGQVSVRGGIVDLFSWHHRQPVRLELFGDEIESIREFDPDTQVSFRTLTECAVLDRVPPNTEKLRASLSAGDGVIAVEADWEGEGTRIVSHHVPGARAALNLGPRLSELPTLSEPATVSGPDPDHRFQQTQRWLQNWLRQGWKLFVCGGDSEEVAEARRLVAAAGTEMAGPDQVAFLELGIQGGFASASGGFVVVPTSYLLRRRAKVSSNRRQTQAERIFSRRLQANVDELTPGDLVVHLEHGVGRFVGFQDRADPGGVTAERPDEAPESATALVVEFAEQSRLFVPFEQSFLLSKYAAPGKKKVELSRLGDGKWAATKRAAERAIQDYAAKLLKVQAMRQELHGYAFAADTAWQKDFEKTFPYRETPDQLAAIEAAKRDMESARPMDRLICGDVGFGKTEVAIRACFKAIMSGKQVAVLVPTTVLAQQHFDNFRQRMQGFPVNVELLSRFRSDADQKKVMREVRAGNVDLVVGTHRILSKDIEFKDLGLLVVDEEQRFGVKHKERVKERYPLVDVLTLSATPIPRTLYLSMVGARDLSTLETPPMNRLPIETIISPYDERLIREVVRREHRRRGQVYFLHNRVRTIGHVRDLIRRLCPSVRVDVGHGQMEEHQLEEVMHRFVRGETDVLVSTTIIESGLDIPNANTIVIDRADMFGLADLYQLRGRVGRGQRQAFAYLLLPPSMLTATGEARKRLTALRQHTGLGVGFQIAMRDLEIRGAGSILGTTQSGHATAIGFDLYCQLLRQAVASLKGERVERRAEVFLRLDFVTLTQPEGDPAPGEPSTLLPAYLPSQYLGSPQLRIQAYRRLAETTDPGQLALLREEWRDRFGPLPAEAENLVALTELKLTAARRGISAVETRRDRLMLTRAGELVMPGGKFPRLTSGEPLSKMREISDLLGVVTR